MFELTPYSRRHNVAAYNPFKELEDFERSFFKSSGLIDFNTDIKDTGKAFELEADLPGFKKEDINIEIDSNYLTVSAERKCENEEKDKHGYIRRERSYGSFSRSFDISGVKTDEIAASYDNGVLKLTMPKKDETVPATRRLEIN